MRQTSLRTPLPFRKIRTPSTNEKEAFPLRFQRPSGYFDRARSALKSYFDENDLVSYIKNEVISTYTYVGRRLRSGNNEQRPAPYPRI